MSGPAPSVSTAVDSTLAFFERLFSELRVDWCVAGAVAANAYRSPCDTTDLDLIVHIPAKEYLAIAARLREQGWENFRVSPEGDYPDVVRLRHDEFFPVDLLLVKTECQREALKRAHPLPGPSAARVLAPEDVIVHKLIAYRYRDRDDIIEILRSGTALDRPYIERWAGEWEVVERWREILTEA
jgi:hypothetical protein